MEIIVALAASGLLLVGLARFFKDFNRSFNLQEQATDRDLNAHYTIKRLSEALMAAGSNLPAVGWDIITLPEGNPGGRIKVSVNPRGGVQYLAGPLAGAYEIPVDDAKGFTKAAAILCDPQDPAKPTFKVDINLGYNSDGFAEGIKNTGKGGLVRAASPVTLEAGDAVYAYDVEDYRIQDGNLMLNNMVLAENLQNLAFTAFTANQTPTSQWSSMRSAKLEITARTRNRDPGFAGNDGYRTLDLSMDVLLRNRL